MDETTRAKRPRPPQGRGLLQAWAAGAPAAEPYLDPRALEAALGPVLRTFGRRGGRVLCLVWTSEPPDPGVEALAAELAKAALGASAAAVAESGGQAHPVALALALASVLTSQAEARAQGATPDERPH